MTTNGAVTKLADFNGTNGAYPRSLLLAGDHSLYGTTSIGENNGGTVFKAATNGVVTTLVTFHGTNGAGPSVLVQGKDGNFYGVTASGGDQFDGTNLYSGYGGVFRMSPSGALTTLVFFHGRNGAYPQAGLVQGKDGNIYGTTLLGGETFSQSNVYSGLGTVFKVTPDGILTTLWSFNGTDGTRPTTKLVEGTDGTFYGTTYQGGPGFDATNEFAEFGTVFKITPEGALTTLVSFEGNNGVAPLVDLIRGNQGDVYGLTTAGGGNHCGTMFRITSDGLLTTLIDFDVYWSIENPDNGWVPNPNSLVQGTDGNFYGTTTDGGDASAGTVFKATRDGALTNLVEFTPAKPRHGLFSLIPGADGHIYGTLAYGGTNAVGAFFTMTTNDALALLASFNGANGAHPSAGLIQASDGNFYGTTVDGGPNNAGTIYKVSPNGLLTTFVSFNRTNGASPNNLLQGADGNFYGITTQGGLQDAGTGFKATASGELTTLVSFDFATNGSFPDSLLQGTDGNLYGTTAGGGANGTGTAFKVTPDGTLVTLASFDSRTGCGYDVESSSLVEGIDGNFYGTRFGLGPWNEDCGPLPGMFFRLTPNGELATFTSFDGTNGLLPSGLIKAVDGSFFGTTYYGGENDAGTVFKITANGILTRVLEFDGVNGMHPDTSLVRGTDGYFYGATLQGGSDGGATLFRLIPAVKFAEPLLQPDGSLRLNGVGPPNLSFRLWASSNVSLPFTSWTLLTSGSFDNEGNLSYTDAEVASHTSRFYQITVP